MKLGIPVCASILLLASLGSAQTTPDRATTAGRNDQTTTRTATDDRGDRDNSNWGWIGLLGLAGLGGLAGRRRPSATHRESNVSDFGRAA